MDSYTKMRIEKAPDCVPAETGKSVAPPVPTVSIGIPVFNGARYLGEALDSLLSQTYTDFEIVISDNASTDTTATLAREYARKDKRIRYTRHERNIGAYLNFSHVFRLARGKYFKWAAADDLCDRFFLERCVAILESDTTILGCYTRTAKIDSTGKRLWHLPDPTAVTSRFTNRPMDASSPSTATRFMDVLLTSGWVFWKVTRSPPLSNLKNNAARRQFASASSPARTDFPRLRLLGGYLTSIFRYPLPVLTRTLCLLAIGRYLLQASKWPHLLRDGPLVDRLSQAHNRTSSSGV